MSFLTAILAWIAKQIMEYLLSRAIAETNEKLKQVQDDATQGKIDEANHKAYEEAGDREARRRAALDLLDGESAP